ncbi:ATP-dependent RNA helicase RhlE [Methylacidimicrobium tartarophylax]|uniref:DEAD-box ATP-dependent RNA helicase RhpA n=2 Tax=Methylacidimicrobium tartarophylax TaxID=1041768 RepID=A0A5E6MGJ6_9BACT|nr:ATP-dependent RNA helicase RhlE [Methylacidimicrobium tartarophylax]
MRGVYRRRHTRGSAKTNKLSMKHGEEACRLLKGAGPAALGKENVRFRPLHRSVGIFMPFRNLALSAPILQAIDEAGYTEPTPIQAAAIPPILAGHDLIGIAQTGTGKTAAFSCPILTKLSEQPHQGPRRAPRALILAPTRELAAQIQENLRTYGKHLSLRSASVFGGVSERPQIEALRSGVDLLVACPGRLLDLHGQGYGDLSAIRYLVLDEADRMLDMGFLPAIRQILRKLPRERQTLLFSATLSPEIESLTREFLRSPRTIEIGRRANPAQTVTQFVYEVAPHLKAALLSHLLQDPKLDTVLVFARTKHRADRLARQIEQTGVKTVTLHSNRSQSQRTRALRDFKAGAARVLVATDIAARGIDVDGISHVINFDFPQCSEDYVHRIGRTGRAQAIGDAISFVTPEDRGPLRSLERFLGRGIPRKQAEGFNHDVPAPAVDPERQPQARSERPFRPRRFAGPGSRPGGRAPRGRRSAV